jgi:electron transfer flavoprotein beta subunit
VAPLIVACLRHTDLRPVVDPLTGAVTRDPRSAGPAPAEAAALEHALRIAEAWDGRVLAVTAGPPAADATLRDARALGAEVVRVPWPPGDGHAGGDEPLGTAAGYLDDLAGGERAVAGALAAAIRAAGRPAAVVCGDRSADRGTGVLPALLAAELGAAQALGLVALTAGDGHLLAERRLDGGRRERLRVPLPAVCSVEAAGVRLRRASLPAVLAAGDGPIPVAEPGTAPAGTAVRAGPARPYRPRPRVLPPPSGDPRARLLALSGALVEHEPPTVIGPVGPAEAADALLAFLGRNGYLGTAAGDDPGDAPSAPATDATSVLKIR